MLELGITFDFAQLVIDNEIAEMIKHVVRGIDVNDYTMAVDVIKEVGIGGEFVTHMHTFENFKKVQTDPKIFDRRMREGWEALGGKDVLEKAREEAKNILENYKPDPLPAGTEKMLEDMVAEGEEELGLK